jgi:5-(aminomethyl)-3-furanmethanol phosphate kinase
VSGWDLLIKVGGSLGRGPSLPALLASLAELARRRRVLIVPGGGVFADVVRAEWARHSIDEARAHRMGLLAMDQYGVLLSALCPRSRTVTDLRTARRVSRAGRTPILLPSSIIDRDGSLERSFRLTSDSIAAFLARRVGAACLVLLKSTDRPDGKVASRAAARELVRLGIVDPLFPEMMPPDAETLILDGRRPERLDGLRIPATGCRPQAPDRAKRSAGAAPR